ncbi:hypothetical protein ACJ41O_005798 [Fusarium nematophilum]
MTWTVAPFVL